MVAPTFTSIAAAPTFTTLDVQEPGANVIFIALVALVLTGLRHFRPYATYMVWYGRVENLANPENDAKSMWYDACHLTFMFVFDLLMFGLATGYLVDIYGRFFPSPGVPFKLRYPIDTNSIALMGTLLLTRFFEWGVIMFVYLRGQNQKDARVVVNAVVFSAKFINFGAIVAIQGVFAFLWDTSNTFATEANQTAALVGAIFVAMAFLIYLSLNTKLMAEVLTPESAKALKADEEGEKLMEPKTVPTARREFLQAYSVIGLKSTLLGNRRALLKGFVPVMSIPSMLLAAESLFLFYSYMLIVGDETKLLLPFACGIMIPLILAVFAQQSAYYFTYQCDMLYYMLLISYLLFWWYPENTNNNLFIVNPDAAAAGSWLSTRQFYMVVTYIVTIASVLFAGWKMQSGIL